MDTNTDPVRAHDELRVQAALLRTPEFMAQFDPDKFAGQLERIAAALATQHQSRVMAKAAGILPAGRNPSAPEGGVKPAPPPNPPKAQEIEALRAEVERLRAGRDSWEQQASDRVADWYAEHLRAERLAEALRDAREFVAEALSDERAKFAGYEAVSDIAGIEATLQKIDAALGQEE